MWRKGVESEIVKIVGGKGLVCAPFCREGWSEQSALVTRSQNEQSRLETLMLLFLLNFWDNSCRLIRTHSVEALVQHPKWKQKKRCIDGGQE